MPHLKPQDVFQSFLSSATNSGHFSWFLIPELRFYQTQKEGWIYAYLQTGKTTLFVLEPLVPPTSDLSFFEETWAEVKTALQVKTAAFFGVYESFKNKIVSEREFQVLKIGHEPWIDLNHYAPKGNTSKGVRAARNQAVRLGARVEEWFPKKDPPLKAHFEAVALSWSRKPFFSLPGFLNTSKPLERSESRRYFVAYSGQNEVQGFLIANPMGKADALLLESLILKPNAIRGLGEVLVLEAFERLSKEGIHRASLGKVLSLENDSTAPWPLPTFVLMVVRLIRPLTFLLLNAEGIETFRKRFKPFHWEPTFICVELTESTEPTLAWIHVLLTTLNAFKPKWDTELKSLWGRFLRTFKAFPLTTGFAGIGFALFGLMNHFGELSETALKHFSFSPQAWWPEWFYRTFTSDLLFFDLPHFAFCYPLYTFLLYRLEKTQKQFFAISFVAAVHFFDDFVNYFLIIKPFQFLESGLYSRLITFKDVGCSLGMVTVLGFIVNTQLRRSREMVLIVITVALVFGYVFAMPRFTSFVLNLNHFLFFMIGYVSGKIQFELTRKKNQQASKGKPPTSTRSAKISH